MIPQYIKQQCPELRFDSLAGVIGPESLKYNCIMYVLGGRSINVWPIDERPVTFNIVGTKVFWPTDLSTDASLDNFIKFFNKFKYEVCDDDSYEKDFRKIALFCSDKTGAVTHAALMHNEDIWTSKMGYGPVIKHRLSSLEGSVYGSVCCFMRRSKTIAKDFDINVIASYIQAI